MQMCAGYLFKAGGEGGGGGGVESSENKAGGEMGPPRPLGPGSSGDPLCTLPR